jgi:hypothetical protein
MADSRVTVLLVIGYVELNPGPQTSVKFIGLYRQVGSDCDDGGSSDSQESVNTEFKNIVYTKEITDMKKGMRT